MENYTFSRTLITEHERDSILIALKTLQATKYPEIDSILDKLGTIFKNVAVADWVHVEFSPWGSGPDENERFLNIKKAILESRMITCDYINVDGVRSHRDLSGRQMGIRTYNVIRQLRGSNRAGTYQRYSQGKDERSA